ncbi:hypothetical protein CSV69_06675 [Sporosarcina sp. P26b]|nr:hypothetical protein CSV69_06675 [Sporosarcina sp. P26b]
MRQPFFMYGVKFEVKSLKGVNDLVWTRGWKLQLADAFPWALGEPTSSLRSLLVVSPFELILREEP